jgi:hypothetical protein
LFTVGIRKRQRVLRSRTITLSVLCNEPCSLIASAHVSGPRGVHRPKARVRVPAISGARRTVHLVFTPAGVARIRRALKDHRRVIATVQVAGADAAKNYGNATAVTVRITG